MVAKKKEVDRLLSVGQVALFLGVSRDKVQRARAKGVVTLGEDYSMIAGKYLYNDYGLEKLKKHFSRPRLVRKELQ